MTLRSFLFCIWILLLLSVGYMLFHITFRVEALESELRGLNIQIRDEKESLHILKAEWAYLSRPERIEHLTRKLLPFIGKIDTRQILKIDDIPFAKKVQAKDRHTKKIQDSAQTASHEGRKE